MRALPSSLRGQLVLLILVALGVAQGVSLWLFVDERGLAVRTALGLEAAGRAANVAFLIEQAPEALQPSILRAASSPLVRFSLDQNPVVDHAEHGGSAFIASRVHALLGGGSDRDVRVDLHQIDVSAATAPAPMPGMAEMHRAMLNEGMSAIEMQLSIALEGGRWLNVGTRFHRPPLQWRLPAAISFGLTAALLLVAACWFLLSRITGPLRRLSAAAEGLGRGEETQELAVTGPAEVRELTYAFNRMQIRLTRFVRDRARLLAALGHDLRSPLTAMRVRAEMVDEEETRERLISSIEEMHHMVDATLAFARGMATSEPSETVEIGQFLDQLQDDMPERFSLEAEPGCPVRLRPGSMRRALRNVIENAQRYGDAAAVTSRRAGEAVQITVADNGPGIPEDQLQRVFDPFYRLEKSRSRETGGTGLGLSIARTIIQAHGGDIELNNREKGGLAATISLPLTGENTATSEHSKGE